MPNEDIIEVIEYIQEKIIDGKYSESEAFLKLKEFLKEKNLSNCYIIKGSIRLDNKIIHHHIWIDYKGYILDPEAGNFKLNRVVFKKESDHYLKFYIPEESEEL